MTNDLTSVVVAQLGARRHYDVPYVLYQNGLLEGLYTDFLVAPDSKLEKLASYWTRLPAMARPELARKIRGRSARSIPLHKVTAFNGLGIAYFVALRLARWPKLTGSLYSLFGRAFALKVVQAGLNGASIVYGFNTASLELFEYAKAGGLKCVLEQTIAPKKIEMALIDEERRRWPGWEAGKVRPGAEQMIVKREEKEWALADLILAGSQFVADGLSRCGVARERCTVVPYGVDVSRFRPATQSSQRRGPVRILFVGEVGLRKGIAYLYEAQKRLNTTNVVVRAVGPNVLSLQACKILAQKMDLAGPLPANEMPEVFRWADIFVFPSICEGSALVIYEALASGVPVITTPNAGSIVRDGIDGFIVPIRDSEAIANCIDGLAANPGVLQEMSRKAVECVQEITRAQYGERLVQALLSMR